MQASVHKGIFKNRSYKLEIKLNIHNEQLTSVHYRSLANPRYSILVIQSSTNLTLCQKTKWRCHYRTNDLMYLEQTCKCRSNVFGVFALEDKSIFKVEEKNIFILPYFKIMIVHVYTNSFVCWLFLISIFPYFYLTASSADVCEW